MRKDKATRMARRLQTWVLGGARYAAAIAVTAAAASAEPTPADGPATPAVAGGLLILVFLDQNEKKESLRPTFSRIAEITNRWTRRSPSNISPLIRCIPCGSIQYRSRSAPGWWTTT